MEYRDIELLRIDTKDLEKIYLQNKEIFGVDCIEKIQLKYFYSHAICKTKIVKPNSNNEIIAAMFIVPYRDLKNTAYISLLYICPSYQRKGLGTYLFEAHVFPYIIQKGYRFLELNTKKSTPGTAKFYEKIGFEIIKEIPNYYRSGDNGYLMRKNL